MWILASMAYAIVVAMILIQTRRPTLSLYFSLSLYLSISLSFSLSLYFSLFLGLKQA